MFLANILSLLYDWAGIKEVLNLFEPQNILSERGKAKARGGGPGGNRPGKKAKKICKA